MRKIQSERQKIKLADPWEKQLMSECVAPVMVYEVTELLGTLRSQDYKHH